MSSKDDEGIAIETGARSVSWIETRTIAVGYHRCGVCRRWTPPPPPHVLEKFCRSPSGHFLWPHRDERSGWTPEGWTHDDERGHVCPSCTQVKNKAWAQVEPVDPRIPPDSLGPTK